MHIPQTLRILVADNHTVVCSGIAALLRSLPDFEVAGLAGSGEDALRLCDQVHPDIVITEIDLPGETGCVDLIHILRRQHPGIRIVVLTNNADETAIHAALRAGATSYLLKNVSVDELSHAVRVAHQGQSTLSPEVTQVLIRAMGIPDPVGRNLTDREIQVLELIARARTNQAIAQELSISLSTVQFHVRNILTKLGVHNRIEAAVYAVRQDLVNPSRSVVQ